MVSAWCKEKPIKNLLAFWHIGSITSHGGLLGCPCVATAPITCPQGRVHKIYHMLLSMVLKTFKNAENPRVRPFS